MGLKSTIESISAYKGIMVVCSCEEYVVIDIDQKKILKRGRGHK